MRNKIFSTLFGFILPILILFLWHYLTTSGKVPTLILPTVSSVVDTVLDQLTNGTLLQDVGISLLRIGKGFGMAAMVGIMLGVLMGMSGKIENFLSLTFTSIRQIPMMAWVPLLVMWFGIGENSKIAVIFMASYFPVLVNTISGIKRTDAKLLEVGKMYQLSKWRMFTEIYLPSSLPAIFVGLKVGLGVSWMAVVGAEMIAASSGIGFRINDARSLMQYPIVFSGMISIAVVGVFMDQILNILAKLLTPWENKQ